MPCLAQEIAKKRFSKAQSQKKEWSKECLKEVKLRLENCEDPDQISNRMKMERKEAPSHETIYKMIYENRYEMGIYACKLRRKHKKRKQRGLKKQRRSPIPNRVGIEHRPEIIGKGHWEGDTVIGKNMKGAIATFADEESKFLIAQLMQDKTSQSLNQAAKESFKDIKHLQTFTFDNGGEFALHQDLTKTLGANCYFANPYHSWERGLNEHTNRLLRQYFPKKTDFTQLTNEEIQLAVMAINNRPRKSLNYLTANEVYFNHSNCQSLFYSSNLDLYKPVASHA
ncbi:MAG TPA: IS30 family transposase [Flavobacterium sp.]|nr:IS30 family transposase [Flavobacterium sp.]